MPKPKYLVLPEGVTPTFSEDNTQLTLTASATANAGTYPFKVTSGDTESAVATLIIEKAAASAITTEVRVTPINAPKPMFADISVFINENNSAATDLGNDVLPDRGTVTVDVGSYKRRWWITPLHGMPRKP